MKRLFHFISSYLFFAVIVLRVNAQTTFNYSGSVQTYTVPPCAGSITVDVKGAEGSSQATAVSPPGKGGRVQATLSVTPGEILNIYVGGAGVAGASAAGGWNGGGNTGTGTGGCGGGASDIRKGTDLLNRIVVAAGGGGAGSTYNTNTKGGDGGGLKGGNGFSSGSYSSGSCGAGGTQTSGGAGASSTYSGSFGTGGNGGAHGGGGGGGYYGGGGGAGATLCCTGGGGGGGSSYADSTATGVVHTTAFQTGNGQVVITPVLGASAPVLIKGPSSTCKNSMVNYSVDTVPGATSYEWRFPAGTTINSGQGTNAVLVTVGDSSGNISVIATNSCGPSPARTLAFTLNDSLYANAGPDTSMCKGSSVVLTASGGANYSWSPAEGLSCTDCRSPVASPSATISYSVIVTATACVSDTDTVTVTVLDCGGTGIDNAAWNKDIAVFPNPATAILYIQISHAAILPGSPAGKPSSLYQPDGKLTLEMMNVQGQVVYREQIKVIAGIGLKILEISSFPRGLYYLRINEENFFTGRKIVIQ